MKKFFKYFLIMFCLLSFSFEVNAAGNYTYEKITYCYTQNGTYGKTLDYANTNCPGYFGGTVVKKINGEYAYCAQKNREMSYGDTCTAASYNQFSWMNGNWTEENAIKVGYMMQYIKSKKFGTPVETVYIVNALNDMLQFDGSVPKRTLNSDIQAAINYANSKYDALKSAKTISDDVVVPSLTSKSLDDNLSVGVTLKLNNTNTLSKMTVTSSCNNCTIYTDSNFTNVFSSTTVNASDSKTLNLYVKANTCL